MKTNKTGLSNEELNRNVGLRLRAIREEKKLTTQYMAEILETTPEQYLEFEEGKSELNGFQILTLKKVLNVSINWLIAGNEDEKPIG